MQGPNSCSTRIYLLRLLGAQAGLLREHHIAGPGFVLDRDTHQNVSINGPCPMRRAKRWQASRSRPASDNLPSPMLSIARATSIVATSRASEQSGQGALVSPLSAGTGRKAEKKRGFFEASVNLAKRPGVPVNPCSDLRQAGTRPDPSRVALEFLAHLGFDRARIFFRMDFRQGKGEYFEPGEAVALLQQGRCRDAEGPKKLLCARLWEFTKVRRPAKTGSRHCSRT